MDEILKQLFDYQLFSQNERLETQLKYTEERYYAYGLTDEELDAVSAAGELTDCNGLKPI